MGIVRANVRFGIDIWDEHHCRRWIWRIPLVQIIADTAIDPAALYAQSPCVRLRLDADQLPLCAAYFVAHSASGLGPVSNRSPRLSLCWRWRVAGQRHGGGLPLRDAQNLLTLFISRFTF